MCNAPFRELLALIDLDGDADLPQNLLVNLADRRANAPTVAGVLKSKIGMKSSCWKYCSVSSPQRDIRA